MPSPCLPDFVPAQKNLAALYAQDPENLAKAFTLATKARAALPDDPALTETLAEPFSRPTTSDRRNAGREAIDVPVPVLARHGATEEQAKRRSLDSPKGRRTGILPPFCVF